MYFSTCDQLILVSSVVTQFYMAAAENLENQQTSIKDYRKTERYPKKLKVYLWTSILKLYLWYSYWVFLRVPTSAFGRCFRDHRATKKQPQGVFEKKIHKIFITWQYFLCSQWVGRGRNYNVIAKENPQIIFDLRWGATDTDRISIVRVSKIGSFRTQRFLFNYSQKNE